MCIVCTHLQDCSRPRLQRHRPGTAPGRFGREFPHVDIPQRPPANDEGRLRQPAERFEDHPSFRVRPREGAAQVRSGRQSAGDRRKLSRLFRGAQGAPPDEAAAGSTGTRLPSRVPQLENGSVAFNEHRPAVCREEALRQGKLRWQKGPTFLIVIWCQNCDQNLY